MCSDDVSPLWHSNYSNTETEKKINEKSGSKNLVVYSEKNNKKNLEKARLPPGLVRVEKVHVGDAAISSSADSSIGSCSSGKWLLTPDPGKIMQ